MIHITVENRTIKAWTDEKLVAKTRGVVYFEAAFDSSWDGYEITVVFSGKGGTKPVLYTGGAMLVPWEPLYVPGRLRISAVGMADGRRDVTAMMMDCLVVCSAGDLGGDPTESDPTLPLLEQAVLACAKSAKEAREAQAKSEQDALSASDSEAVALAAARAAEEAAKRAEDAGGGTPSEPGNPGKDGGYYVPKVTQQDSGRMRMSFTPSREEMPAVQDEEVELPPGPAGHTPVKGEDYFTKTDKQEIVDDVLAEIPEGGSIDVSGATVGQTIKIAAVDENGVPTAWEPVEFPSGGGSGGFVPYKLLMEIETYGITTSAVEYTIPDAEKYHDFIAYITKPKIVETFKGACYISIFGCAVDVLFGSVDGARDCFIRAQFDNAGSCVEKARSNDGITDGWSRLTLFYASPVGKNQIRKNDKLRLNITATPPFVPDGVKIYLYGR